MHLLMMLCVRLVMSGPPNTSDHSAMCLNVPFGANGKKRKSLTAAAPEASSSMDTDHAVMHNLDTASELPLDDDLLKHRRLIDNSAGSGLCL